MARIDCCVSVVPVDGPYLQILEQPKQVKLICLIVETDESEKSQDVIAGRLFYTYSLH